MTVTIRTVEPGEQRAFAESVAVPFFESGNDLALDHMGLHHEPGRCWVGVDRGRFVANAAVLSRDLTVPGRAGAPCPTVALCAITSVGVHPTHRRQGLLHRLMTAMVEQGRERAEPLAGLIASEGGIYGRFGFGRATRAAQVRLDTRRSTFVSAPPALDLSLVSADEAGKVVPELFEAIRRGRPGEVNRNEAAWASRIADLQRGSAGPCTWAVSDAGYVAYRFALDAAEGWHRARIDVIDLLGVDADAEAGLWRYLTGIDLVTEVVADKRPVDEPLSWRLADPRAWRVTRIQDVLWLRVLDLPAAVAARCYPQAGTLVIDVRAPVRGAATGASDPVTGRWRIEVGPDGGSAAHAAAGDRTDLSVGLDDLGSLYLGDVTAATLVAAGRVVEERPGAAGEADRLLVAGPGSFSSTGF